MKKFLIGVISSLLVFSSIAATAEEILEGETEFSLSEDEIYELAHIIMGEGEGQSWDFKVAIGSVVLNRVKDERFPNTVYDVIFEAGQWAPTWDGRYWLEPNEECWEVAEWLSENGSDLPEDVVWASAVKQGKEIYEKIEGIYFCK